MFLAIGFQAEARQSVDGISGFVYSAVTGMPLTGAHVYVPGHGKGTTTAGNGGFRLDNLGDADAIIISHVGFKPMHIPRAQWDPQQTYYFLEPEITRLTNDILITANRSEAFGGLHTAINTKTSEEFISGIAGVDLVNRANFAREPVIRGLSGPRVPVLIDGMRLTPACVDGMDPETAYIETENLKSIEIEKGSGNAAGTAGSVNFGMVRPQPGTGFGMQAETGFQSVSRQQLYQAAVSLGASKTAFRVSGTFRDAGNFRAGNGEAIGLSGFRKGNILITGVYQPTDAHQLSARYIGDFAANIGYPALIMDTRSADAHIFGVEHNWNIGGANAANLTSRLYANQVQHWMDDYDRDVANRPVMANMYMPMFGETQTFGMGNEFRMLTGPVLFNAGLEAYRVHAFADMWMYHVSPGVSDMYLVNLGDVRKNRIRASSGFKWFSGGQYVWGMDASVETAFFDIHEESAKNTLKAEYPGIETARHISTASIAVTAERTFTSGWMLATRASFGGRLPDHMELYSYYVYQPLDGFFYHGNPGLDLEYSLQGEISLQLPGNDNRFAGTLNLWANHISGFIAGGPADMLFRRYANTGDVLLAGFELQVAMKLNADISVQHNLSLTHGRHLTLDEPLPMMPPLGGRHLLIWEMSAFSVQAGMRWAATQNRVAGVSTLESPTKGWLTFDLRVEYRFDGFVVIQAGADNLLDRHYHEHLSVNRLPSPGRNLYASLRVLL